MREWSWVVLTALAMGPFEKNHPLIDDGEAAYERGDYEGALSKFDAADKELPNNAQVAFDRGTALHKLGRHDEARAAFLKAAELNQGKAPLDSKIHYNLGNSWAATSNKKEAIAEYRKALRKDPANEQARHNLEVILKDLPPPQSSGSDGGTPDSGHGDAGRADGGADGGKPADAGAPVDGGRADGGAGDGGADGGDGGQGPGDGGRGDGGQGDGGSGEGEKKSDGGSQSGERGDGGSDGGEADADAGIGEGEAAEAGDGGEEMSKKEAERMLDSLKNTERNMQLWRFRQDKKRRANEKDW